MVYNKLCVAKSEGCSRNVSEKKNFVYCVNLVNGKFCSEASNSFGGNKVLLCGLGVVNSLPHGFILHFGFAVPICF